MRRGKKSLKPLTLRMLQEAGWKPEALVLEPDSSGQVRTDPEQISAVEASLHRKAGVISLGSGTVTDITKQACYGFEERTGHHLIYVACPTANSVGAYTSNVITVFIRGIKRSMTSRLPDALVYDLETLCDAPHTMTVAGRLRCNGFFLPRAALAFGPQMWLLCQAVKCHFSKAPSFY